LVEGDAAGHIGTFSLRPKRWQAVALAVRIGHPLHPFVALAHPLFFVFSLVGEPRTINNAEAALGVATTASNLAGGGERRIEEVFGFLSPTSPYSPKDGDAEVCKCVGVG